MKKYNMSYKNRIFLYLIILFIASVFIYLYYSNIIFVRTAEHGLVLNREDYKNGYIYDIFIQGKRYKFEAKDKNLKIDPGVINFKYRMNKIVQFLGYVMPINEKIMSRKNSSIELEYSGDIGITSDFCVYSISENNVSISNIGSIIVGAKNIKLFKDKKGLIKTAVIEGNTSLNFIRVGIKNSGFSDFEHKTLDFISNSPVKIECKKENKYINIPAKTEISLRPASSGISLNAGSISAVFKDRIYISSDDADSYITLLTFRRSYGNPAYRGTFEITSSLGSLNLINEVGLEEYLYQVVPSEMPASFGLEALKAQAVAARTYAVSDLLSGRYASSGFHVDDSTMSQVYNNTPENPLATKAVNETKGMVLTFNGELVDAKYYSTSDGYGANSDEIWSSDGKFPGKKVPYLTAKSYLLNNKQYNLSDEKEALAFFKDWSLKSYDSNSPYFRWKVQLTKDEIKNTIEKNLPIVYSQQSDYILTLINGNFISRPIPENCIGELKDLQVTKRGEGGNIMELVVAGSNGTYKIIKELNVRYVIRPRKTDTNSERDIVIKRIKSGDLKNNSLLPSAFMAFEINRDNYDKIKDVTIYGGGYGHGVGMSQYGAGYLCSIGYSFTDILKTYYNGTTIEKLY